MAFQWILFAFISMAIAILTVLFKKLTAVGAITGFIIGLLIFWAFQWAGVALMFLFFILSVIATSMGKKRKGDASHPRDAWQVFANAGMAFFIAGSQAILYAKDELFVLLACAFSAAVADTVSSEIGQVYGKRFYNILTFRRDRRGRNGVISLEGCLAGLAGSILMAAVAFIFYPNHLWIIVIAGTAGNIADSVMGAILERKDVLNNNEVNFLNTLAAVLTGILLLLLGI